MGNNSALWQRRCRNDHGAIPNRCASWRLLAPFARHEIQRDSLTSLPIAEDPPENPVKTISSRLNSIIPPQRQIFARLRESYVRELGNWPPICRWTFPRARSFRRERERGGEGNIHSGSKFLRDFRHVSPDISFRREYDFLKAMTE